MPGVFVIASGVVRDAILTELITLKESHRHQKVFVLARDDAEEAALSDAWNTDGCVPTSAWVVCKGAGALSRAWVCTPALVPSPITILLLAVPYTVHPFSLRPPILKYTVP